MSSYVCMHVYIIRIHKLTIRHISSMLGNVEILRGIVVEMLGTCLGCFENMWQTFGFYWMCLIWVGTCWEELSNITNCDTNYSQA